MARTQAGTIRIGVPLSEQSDNDQMWTEADQAASDRSVPF